jgi:hypothetical protein
MHARFPAHLTLLDFMALIISKSETVYNISQYAAFFGRDEFLFPNRKTTSCRLSASGYSIDFSYLPYLEWGISAIRNLMTRHAVETMTERSLYSVFILSTINNGAVHAKCVMKIDSKHT